jgi:hypothetical protein
LDRSLHASVLVGLVFMTFFTETLGWSYGGLVVPGYLATVLIAAPVTGMLIVFEAIATYLFVRLVGEWITKTDAWSTTFGRERFFLFLVCAVLVRLGVEGTVVPWLLSRYRFTHARELYSIGLVLVPLIANSIWNAGLLRGLPRMGILTALTILFVKCVLMRWTNLSVSSFQINNESVSQAFLDTPKEQIILLLGALLGARNNVEYGWDYNGILVPGLLAVSWFQPMKLGTSIAEAIVLYLVLRALVKVRPFSRMLIVGPRRMLLAYFAGFLLKMALGFLVFRIRPEVRMADYYGFGYLLPTLIAVKIWNKERIGIVLMPTLQVSVLAFVLGSLLGFAMMTIDKRVMAGTAVPPREPPELERTESVPWELLLGDSAPRPETSEEPWSKRGDRAYELALDVARELEARGRPGAANVARTEEAKLALRIHSEDGVDWLTMAPRTAEPDDPTNAPRAAIRAAAAARGGWGVIVESPRAGSALVGAGWAVAKRLNARALVVVSRYELPRRRDERFAEELLEALGIAHAVVIRSGDQARWSVLGAFPPGLDVEGIGRDVEARLDIAWRGVDDRPTYLLSEPRLELPEPLAEGIAARALGAPSVEVWAGSLREELLLRFTSMTGAGPAGYRAPSIEELRVFRSVVWPALAGLPFARVPSGWELAVARGLGYAFARTEGEGAYVLYEPAGERRRGHATLVMRPHRGEVSRRGPGYEPPLVIEVPAPRWEVGTFGAGLSFSLALGADGLLFSGVMPNEEPLGTADVRRSSSRRSYYQTMHECWLTESDGYAVALDGILPEREARDLVVVSFGREVLPEDAVPKWSERVLGALANAGLPMAIYDGSRAFAAMSGASDMGMAYAERFAPDHMAMLWLSASLRSRFLATPQNRISERLDRAKVAVTNGDAAVRARTLANDCAPRAEASTPRPCPFARETAARCDLEVFSATFDRYALEGNPLDLVSLVHGPSGCYVEVVRDRGGSRFALGARPGHVRLVPLEARGAPLHSAKVLTSLDGVRSAVDVGVAMVDVEAAP